MWFPSFLSYGSELGYLTDLVFWIATPVDGLLAEFSGIFLSLKPNTRISVHKLQVPSRYRHTHLIDTTGVTLGETIIAQIQG